VGEAAGVAVIDDYAHHPSEVRATIAAARARYPQARVIAIYVAHTYSRTHALLDAYGDAFAGAELALIGPIEPARERHLAHTVSAGEVAARAQTHTRAEVVDSAKAAAARAAATARPGDVVLCMSVRGFDRVALKVVAALRERG
jgi:UDP-N-acetylmuramate--alanine ligase